MSVLQSYRCNQCEKVVDARSDDIPVCHNSIMNWFPSSFSTPEWGGPRDYKHLREEQFSGRSELESWTKSQGLVLGASAEKHGGARNEEHLNLGKRTYFNARSSADRR